MLHKYPPEVLGEILEYLASPTVFTLWICGDRTLNKALKTPGVVRRFGLDWNLQIKPTQLSFPSIILTFRHINELCLILNSSYRAKPMVSEFDFEKLPPTLRKLKLNFLQILPIWSRHAEDGFTWANKFPSLTYLDIETDGSMTKPLFETLPPYLDSLRLKLSVCAGMPEHMILLPKELRNLYLEHPNGEPMGDMCDAKFPNAITNLTLNVKWALSCEAYPPNLHSFSVTCAKPPIGSLGRLPQTLKFLHVNIVLPLDIHLVPLLPSRLEHLEWYLQDLDQACLDLLPKSLTHFYTKVSRDWLLPPQLTYIGSNTVEVKNYMPPNLETLHALSIDSSNVNFLPKALVKLSVSIPSLNMPIELLPATLTSLTLSHDIQLSPEQVSALPKSLTVLHARLGSDLPWRAESLPPNICDLNITGAVDEESIESLKALKSLRRLSIYSYHSTPYLGRNSLTHLPKNLLTVHMPYSDDFTAAELKILPPCLTLLSFACHGTHTRLTLQDYKLYWPSFLSWARIPPYAPDVPQPSKQALQMSLPSLVETITSYQGNIYERPLSAHTTICWEEDPFLFYKKSSMTTLPFMMDSF